jgi:hypothetical protein
MAKFAQFTLALLFVALTSAPALAGPGCMGGKGQKGKGSFQQQQAFKQFQQMQQLAKQNKALEGQLKQGKK